MKPATLLLICTLLPALSGALHAAPPSALASDPDPQWRQGLTRTDIARRDVSTTGYELIQARVDFASGVASPRHSHSGDEVAFVLEGTLEYLLAGRPPVTLQAGQALVIPAGTPHVARNAGTGRASELATYLVSKGASLVKAED